jgi:AraC family transcriptional activator of mtrCDE
MTDVLTNVLRSLRLRVGLLGRGDYYGNWALDFGALDKAVFHLIGHGPIWLHCNMYAEPLELNEGDVLFFPQPQWHQFSATPERHQQTSIVAPGEGDGPIKSLVCCTVEFESRAFNPIFSSLPAVLIGHCQDEFASAELAALTRLVLSEYDGTTPGYEAMRERLAEALLIQLLRYYMRTATELQGLLRALTDPQLARALAALHAEPGREWDVDTLAAQASMSRSAFARRFGECVGTSPMQYLAEWRMHLADQMLRERRQSVAQVAEALGYKTEAAFRHAFKRARGIGPGEVRRGARGAVSTRLQ